MIYFHLTKFRINLKVICIKVEKLQFHRGGYIPEKTMTRVSENLSTMIVVENSIQLSLMRLHYP